MPCKEGGPHPALQGRKVYVAIRPFGSGPRGRGNIGGSFLGGHFRKREEEWEFQRRKSSKKMATMEDNERVRKYVEG
jgi:hypothetical protein